MFELGFTQLGILGAAILAIGLYVMAEQNKYYGLWISYVGLVIIGGGLVVHLHKTFAEGDRSRSPIAEADSPERAWVSIEIQIAGPLAFDATGWDAGKRWHIPVQFRLTNTGNTPATNVDFHAEIRPFMIAYWAENLIKDGIPQGPPVQGTDAAIELKKLCENVAGLNQHVGSLMGKTLFKGQVFEGLFHINGNPALFDAARMPHGYSGNILLLACATYKSKTDDRLHQTGESFAIFKPNGKIVLEDGTVPQIELRLTGQPMGGNFAN